MSDSFVAYPGLERRSFLVCGCLRCGLRAVYNFLPATFPVFKREFGTSLAQMGQVQFIFFLSGIGYSAVGGFLIAVLGLKQCAVSALLLGGSALLLISHVKNFDLVLVAAAIFGFSTACMAVISSSIVTAHFQQRRQSVFSLTVASGSRSARLRLAGGL